MDDRWALPGRTKEGDEHSMLVCVTPDPIGLLEEEHALQRELCDLLEHVADSLPHEMSVEQATVARSILSKSYKSHTVFEEKALFPMLRQRVASDDPLFAMLAQLEAEHAEDDGQLVEILEALDEMIAGKQPHSPEVVGYLLRGFFEHQRRHIAWEDEVVLPAARRLLTADDLSALQRWVMDSGHPRCAKRSIVEIKAVRSGGDVCRSCGSARIKH